jgi:hypothetical protein
MSARKNIRQEAGSRLPSRATLQAKGAFSRSKDGVHTATLSSTPHVLRQSYSKFLAEERMNISSGVS